MPESPQVSVRHTIVGAPTLPYRELVREILGTGYDISIVVCGDKLARSMNTRYRARTYSPNVLSFPYSTREGEIFLNVRKAEREARALRISTKSRLALLFVHACFHLLGHKHGDRMEMLEQKTLKRFGLSA